MSIKKAIIICSSLLISIALLFGISYKVTRKPADAPKAERFGFLTLLPPFISIVLAFVTKETVSSLFVGVLIGEYMTCVTNLNVAGSLVDSFLLLGNQVIGTMADKWNAGIILQSLLIGGVIQLVAKMGGAKALAEALAKRANSPRKGQLITECLGLLVFFDDYANSLIIGPMMRPVIDRLGISREKLAFLVDATAAPVAGIAIISTWIGLEVGLITDSFKGIGKEVSGFGIFLKTIPFRFYNILILLFIAMTAVTLYEFGPMKKAEQNARKRLHHFKSVKSVEAAEDDDVDSQGSVTVDDDRFREVKPVEGIKPTIWNAIIPIGTLVFGALISFYYNGYTAIMAGEDKDLIKFMHQSPFSAKGIFEALAASDSSVALFHAALFASVVSIVMAVSQKIKFDDAISEWVSGMKSIVITCVILLLAWSLGDIIKELGTADYLVAMLKDSIPKFILPSLIFVMSAIISFATGTSYGTMGILMPLTIPLAWAIKPDMEFVIICCSGVLSGSIFGDHCSPISDTTILSSMGSGCDHIEHVRTQIYYSIYIALITVFICYIPAGFGIYWYFTIPASLVVMYLGLRIFGEKVEAPTSVKDRMDILDIPEEIKIDNEKIEEIKIDNGKSI